MDGSITLFSARKDVSFRLVWSDNLIVVISLLITKYIISHRTTISSLSAANGKKHRAKCKRKQKMHFAPQNLPFAPGFEIIILFGGIMSTSWSSTHDSKDGGMCFEEIHYKSTYQQWYKIMCFGGGYGKCITDVLQRKLVSAGRTGWT